MLLSKLRQIVTTSLQNGLLFVFQILDLIVVSHLERLSVFKFDLGLLFHVSDMLKSNFVDLVR